MRKRDPEQPLKLPLLQPLDNDFCPCGGRRPWKLCHGGTPALASPKIENAAIDPTLLALAMKLVTVLKDAIESVKIDLDDFETELRQRCLLYFAKKMYRVTLAGITLVQAGQSSVAFTLKRDQQELVSICGGIPQARLEPGNEKTAV